MSDIQKQFTVGPAWVGTKVYRDEYVLALEAALRAVIDVAEGRETTGAVMAIARVRELLTQSQRHSEPK